NGSGRKAAGNRHDKPLFHAGGVVERRKAAAVVGDPERARPVQRYSPRVRQLRVGEQRFARNIGYEIRLRESEERRCQRRPRPGPEHRRDDCDNETFPVHKSPFSTHQRERGRAMSKEMTTANEKNNWPFGRVSANAWMQSLQPLAIPSELLQ